MFTAGRRKILLLIGISILLLVSEAISNAQQQQKDARYYAQQAMNAHKEKNYSSYLENMKNAYNLRPDHPTIIYNLAGAHALNGNHKEALELISRVAEMGLIYPAASDADFALVKDSEEFQSVLKRFEANKAGTGESSTAFKIEEKGIITEGIAYDPIQEVFYISSVRGRKILSVNKRGEVKDFTSGDDGQWGLFGLKIDQKRRHLWVCSAALPQIANFKEEDKGRSGIFKYDLSTGKLIKKYLLPEKPKAHILGDLVLNSKGDLFATDSQSPEIYQISHQKDELELFMASEKFASLQGLDLSEDERTLFVADYARGIFAIDMKTGELSRLTHPNNMITTGIDGLYFYKNSLIGVQNGINPNRVVRLFLSQDEKRIDRLEILEANNPLFDEPTLGVLVKDSFYYIGNSQWRSVDDKGRLAPADKLLDSVVFKTDLKDKKAALNSLVNSELEFSKRSTEKGIRDSFLHFLADDSILFRPQAVAGKKWMLERPAAPGLLTWRPAFADISNSEDFGYTTGPYEFRRVGPDDKEVGHGNYMSVWKRGSGGVWKVVIDIGTPNPPPVTKITEVQSPADGGGASVKKSVKIDLESEKAALLNQDVEFSKASAAKGMIPAFLSFADQDIRLLRPNTHPIIGKQAMESYLSQTPGNLVWNSAGGDISSAGDLGYTYGIAEFKKAGGSAEEGESNSYVRIWKKRSDGSWKVVFDITNPIPRPKN
jgi:ketosteroid isomerase-like protein/sugar lactone lactonase YvrE